MDTFKSFKTSYQSELIKRSTQAGFKMGFHRDNYLLRRFHDK